MAVEIKLRAGSAATWTSTNPTLALGEPGYETDTGNIKYGTGATAWTSLAYYTTTAAPHTHVAADITSGTFADARIAASNVTQHQAALAIAASQITSGTFADARISQASVTQWQGSIEASWGLLVGVPSKFPPDIHLHDTSDIDTGTFADARIAASNVTQHQAALAIAASQTTSGTFANARISQASVSQHLCPPNRYRWTDFEDTNTQVNDPFFGGVILSGTLTVVPPVGLIQVGTHGLCLIRSSTTSNSGGRWNTSTDRLVGQADLYFRAILAIADDMALKTVRFGFYDATLITAPVDGTFFELVPGSMVCTPKSRSNNIETAAGTTYTLAADTYYIFEVYWTSTSSINFRILSMDGLTEHLNVDITTDIPTGTSRVFGAGLIATSSDTLADNLLVIDYMGVGFKNRR